MTIGLQRTLVFVGRFSGDLVWLDRGDPRGSRPLALLTNSPVICGSSAVAKEWVSRRSWAWIIKIRQLRTNAKRYAVCWYSEGISIIQQTPSAGVDGRDRSESAMISPAS